MTKRANKYRLALEQLESAGEEKGLHGPLQLEFDNHDELFGIIDRVKQKNPFGDPDHSTQFAIGLKMFSEVLLKNRSNPLFEEFAPAFREFMKKLKQS